MLGRRNLLKLILGGSIFSLFTKKAEASQWKEISNNPPIGGYVPTGSIFYFAIPNNPSGYLYCNGAEISRTTYSELFNLIGTLYGSGNGLTTFNLPDLRGEFIRGFDWGRGIDSGRNFGSYQNATNVMGRTFSGNTSYSGYGNAVGTDFDLTSDSDSYQQIKVPNSIFSFLFAIPGFTILPTYDTGSFNMFRVRPRNISLLPCIKY